MLDEQVLISSVSFSDISFHYFLARLIVILCQEAKVVPICPLFSVRPQKGDLLICLKGGEGILEQGQRQEQEHYFVHLLIRFLFYCKKLLYCNKLCVQVQLANIHCSMSLSKGAGAGEGLGERAETGAVWQAIP